MKKGKTDLSQESDLRRLAEERLKEIEAILRTSAQRRAQTLWLWFMSCRSTKSNWRCKTRS